MVKHSKSGLKNNRRAAAGTRKSAGRQPAQRVTTPQRPGRKTAVPKPAGSWTVGLDVGDRWSWFYTIDEAGDAVTEGKLSTTPTALQLHFASLAPARVALEAGTHSAWISRLIQSCGHDVIVANPRELRKIYQSHRKNDRSDAQILARIARVDPRLLAPIQHRTAKMQTDLALVRARDVLVRARTQCINATRGLVKPAGVRLPKCDPGAFAKRVAPFVPAELKPALSPLITTIQELTAKIRRYDDMIEELSTESYPQTTLLQQVQGVGPVTSLAFVLTIADAQRFSKSRTVGAYLGLVPRQDDSGEHSPELPISKAGNRFLRRLLVTCAHYIIGPFGPDTDLRRYGLRLTQHGGKNAKKRAVVAVARKLAILLHRLWVTGEVYEPLRRSQSLSISKAA